jgi:cytochrome c-type biogenesis protein
MILEIFSSLSGALNSAPQTALFASFAWGVLSILLSPCHLSSIPLIVGFINGQGKVPVKRAFLISLLFSAGILLTVAALGLATGLAGRMLGDIGAYGKYFVAAVFFTVGLYLLDVIPLPFLSVPAGARYSKKGLFAAFVLGLVFGAALGPCTFAYMAPMLGVVFSVGASDLPFAAALILAYALGHVSVIIAAGTFSEAAQLYLDWNERSKGSIIVKRTCGALIILGGIYLLAK